MPTVRLLLIFAITFSLVSLPSALSNRLNLPSIHLANATNETGVGNWYPAGAQEQTMTISEGIGLTSTCFSWLSTNQVDACDWPLPAAQQNSCAGNTGIFCSLPVPDHGYFEVQFNLAGVIWGIPMDYGNSAAGIELRQGFGHLFNKQSFTNNNAACSGAVCVPNDTPVPPCTTSAGCTNGGLPASNPCSWDTKYTETSSTNCVVGAPGGTAYNCNFSTACPTGTVIGTTNFPWQAAIGSRDFCAAAQHFIQAFSDANITGVTTNANCELVPPRGGWPSVVTSVTSSMSCDGGLPPTANTCAFVRTTEPRKSLGEGLTQDICALFSPAWGAWTTLAGQNFSCDNFSTGTGNAACGGGPCPFLEEVEGSIGQFCGFNTSTNGVPSNCWGFGTFGFGQVFPFDSTLYYVYNSGFATKTTVTCINANCSFPTPGSPCASNVLTNGASDYMYLCSPTYDNLTKAMEFSTCRASPSTTNFDPTDLQASPTFASCAGTAVSGGIGATTCIGTSPVCSAVSAGYQAEDYFGSHVFTIPVWTGFDTQARLSNWPLGGSSPGFITAFGNGGYTASASIWEWLDAYSSSPAVAGTFRQGLLTTVDSLNPFVASTLWDSYVLSNIYDSLFVVNPQCDNTPSLALAGSTSCASIFQVIDWMTTSHSFLCYPSGPPCTSTTLGYGNSTYFAGTAAVLRLSLNRSNHWQDGGPVTAWDVKYSLMNLNATGAFQASGISNISGLNVLDEYTLDVTMKTRGPFTEYFLRSINIIPGHIWSDCGRFGANTWNNGISDKNIVGGVIVTAAEDSCVGHFGAPNIVVVNNIRADDVQFDPVTEGFLIGSGPYTCESIGGTGHPVVGTIGGGCSIDNTQAPPFGLNDFTLTRTGCTLTATGTTCGVAGSGSDYFRSSGALAAYIWTGDIGSGSADFSKVLTVNSCHSATPSANCPHWAQGIGNPSATSTSNLVGVAQRTRVNSFKGISWIAFSTEKTAGTQLILSCAASYTLPGTTITPCTATNAGWTNSVLPGIGSYAATFYEVGSQITPPGGTSPVSTSTLAPASAAGCNLPYPVGGGYDC